MLLYRLLRLAVPVSATSVAFLTFVFLFCPVFYEKDLTERGFKWNNDEGRVQHDAHELIRLLIDRLEVDMKFSKVNSGLVSALYEGELANQVRWEGELGQSCSTSPIVFGVYAYSRGGNAMFLRVCVFVCLVYLATFSGCVIDSAIYGYL